MLRLTPLAGAMLLLAPLGAQAQALSATLPAVVVSATRHALPLIDAPAAMTVVTAEQLAERGTDNLLQALRAEPGVTSFGRPIGGRKALALRGMDPRHTLILVDGKRIAASDGLVGASDFQLDWTGGVDIERVEVVRGPMSVLYGAEALGGVINVITRPLPDRWGATVFLEGRDGDGGGTGHRAGASLRMPLGAGLKAALSLSDSYRASTPSGSDARISAVEGRHPTEVALRLEAEPAKGHRLNLDVRGSDEDRWLEARERSGLRRYHESFHTLERRHAALAWEAQWASGWESQLRTYGTELAVSNLKTNGVASLRPNTLNDRVLEGQVGGDLGRDHRLTAGFELRNEQLDNSGLPGGHAEADHRSVYGQMESRLSKGFTLTAGLRSDDTDRFGRELSPRVYGVWKVAPQWVVKGGYGHGFKAPNLKQIDPSYREDEGPNTYIGRADLSPETNDNVELGASWEGGAWAASGMAFRNRIRDLILPRLISGNAARGTYQFENLDAAVIQGVELALAWRQGPWHVQAHTTLLNAKDDKGWPLDKRAREVSGVRLDYRADAWSAGLAWERQARLYLASSTAGQPPQAVPRLNQINLYATLRLSPQIRLRAGVDNLGNLRLAEKSPLFSYEELPRSFRLGVEARW
ncbi:TonB-dependent receptor plug domain-containing protein [Inhella gelatinilytica]|uniref:TonB-dependent receptor n=1 Tax=Inhella gelatinilytica TaxID=2795030 RepID=A0A931IU02_9BURK|nr:TonB-dependent receptor [Inhella gelatinilytica]MBH9552114.1 TonB-dependent receptor [Inhella gelatinilytica]